MAMKLLHTSDANGGVIVTNTFKTTGFVASKFGKVIKILQFALKLNSNSPVMG